MYINFVDFSSAYCGTNHLTIGFVSRNLVSQTNFVEFQDGKIFHLFQGGTNQRHGDTWRDATWHNESHVDATWHDMSHVPGMRAMCVACSTLEHVSM